MAMAWSNNRNGTVTETGILRDQKPEVLVRRLALNCLAVLSEAFEFVCESIDDVEQQMYGHAVKVVCHRFNGYTLLYHRRQ